MYSILKGLKILDLTRLLPGGYATQFLADLGAEVLKVEDPWQGDYMRWMKPHMEGTNENFRFMGFNRNKKSMKLNLKNDDGKQIFFKLLATYDVVLESFRPGVMQRLGLGYENLREINPKVILCSISGYGQDGAFSQRAGHDINYISIAGMLGLTGKSEGSPVMPAVQVADIGGGALMAVVGVLAAICNREKTGQGQYMDVSMMDSVISWMSGHFMEYQAGRSMVRGETVLGGGEICYNVYQTADGKYMSLGALEPKFWEQFCYAVGREDFIEKQFLRDPEFKKEVEKIFSSKTQAEWIKVFGDKDACCEPVLDLAEVQNHPHVKDRKLFKQLKHPIAGLYDVVANPIKFPFDQEERDSIPPLHGEHTEEILKQLGYNDQELEKFREENAI